MVVKGKKLTFKEYLQKVKSEFKGMTPRQKLEHFWEYYKWIPILFAAVVFVIMAIVGAVQSLNTTLRAAGALINVEMSADGFMLIQDGYAEHIGAQSEDELVNLYNMQFKDPFTTLDQSYALDVHESVLAMVEGKTLDYLLFDDVALPFFLDPELLLDLRELFTQQELDAMGTAVIYLQIVDTGEKIPVALNISDTAFYQQYIIGGNAIYLGFIVNTPRQEICRDFWLYLKGGQTAQMETMVAGTVVDASLSEDATAMLSRGFFEKQGYALGDQRVELTIQSFLQPEGEQEDVAAMVQQNVRATLEAGSLDYLIVDQAALQTLSDVQLLDLRQILPEDQIAKLADSVIYRDGMPVAVELSATALGQYCEGKAYLAFNANTQRTEQCKALWAFVSQ